MLQVPGKRILEDYDDEDSPDYGTCWSFLRCYKKQINRNSQKLNNLKQEKQQIMQGSGQFTQTQLSNDSIQKVDDQRKDIQLKKSGERSSYPLNKIFYLKSLQPKLQMLAKITQKKFNFNLKQENNDAGTIQEQFIDTIQKKEIFKLYDLGIKCTLNESWWEATPERIAKYIAHRVRNYGLIIDLGCGIGGNTIQFAQECDFVIGVEINYKKILDAMYNCQKYQVSEKVDFVLANLLTLKYLKADVVFLNPTVRMVDDKIDLFRDCSPNIYQIMETVLHIAPNIIIQFPKNIDITQLPAIFDINRYEFLKNKYPYDYILEIEQVIVNKQIEYYIIYFGQVTNIGQNELNQFLYKLLLSEGSSDSDGIDYTDILLKLLEFVKKTIGSYKLNLIINNIIKQHGYNSNLLNNFIEHLKSQNIITKYDIQQLIQLPKKSNSFSIQIETQKQQNIKQKQQTTLLIPSSNYASYQKHNFQTPEEEILYSIEQYSFKSDDFLPSDDISYTGFQGSFFYEPSQLQSDPESQATSQPQ